MKTVYLFFILFALVFADVFHGDYKLNHTQVANAYFKIQGEKNNFQLYVSIFTEQNPKEISFYDRILNITLTYSLSTKIQILNIINQTDIYDHFHKETINSKLVTDQTTTHTQIISDCKKKKPLKIEWKVWITFSIVFSLLGSLVLGVGSAHFNFLIACTVMILFGIVTTDEFMQGFSNEGMMTIGMMFVVVTPVAKTGILQLLTKSVFIFKNYPRFNLLIIMVTCSILSLWMNNTPIVALFIPLIRDWCIENDVSPSKFLIPLSYSTIAGGMCTIIGTSTNLVVDGFMEQVGEKKFGFFELGYIGFIILAVLIIYIVTIGYCLLPNHKPSDKKKSEIGGNIYICEIPILPYSYLKNKTVNYINNRFLIEIFEIQRLDSQIKIQSTNTDKISVGDKIIFKSTSQNLVNMMDIISYDLEDFAYKKFSISDKGTLNQDEDQESQPLLNREQPQKKKNFLLNLKDKIFPEDSKNQFFEIIIGDQFSLLNQKLKSRVFQEKFSCEIYGIRRTGEEIIDLTDYEFKVGDQIIVLSSDSLDQVQSSEFFNVTNINVEKSAKEEKKVLKLLDRRYDITWWRYISIPIFMGMVLCAALTEYGMFSCALVTICIMVLFGLIDGNEGIDCIDFKLMILIACSMSIGKGIQNSYLAETLSALLLRIPFPKYILPGIIFLITQTVSATVTNNAAATIVFPVAYALAERVNMPFRPFGIAVALGASAEFSTPIGYQTNLMVQRPGMYSFFDYTKVGLPLNLMCSGIAMGLLPLIYK